jgi:hypothetical protein
LILNWNEKIALILFAYKNKKQKSSKVKLAYRLVYSKELKLLNNIKIQPEDRLNELLKLLKARNKVKKEITKFQDKQKNYHNMVPEVYTRQ